MKGTGTSFKLVFVSRDNTLQNILRKIKNSSKVRENHKASASVSFLNACAKN